MEKITEALENKLLNYLDGALSEADAKSLEKQFLLNASLKARLEELRALDITLQNLVPEQPSKNFTQSVMDRLDQYPLQRSVSIRKSISLVIGALAVASIGSVLVSYGIFDGVNPMFDMKQIYLPDKDIKQTLPSFNLNTKMMVNSIIFLNLAIALVLLDRTILRPFFQHRG